ncbi:MAG: hypothetical protein QW209_06375 [Nitrososphaerota archaeon]
MVKEYFTKSQFTELLDRLYDILSEAEAEGVITNSEDLLTRISELETELKRLTKSEIIDEIKKLMEKWSPGIIPWMRKKRYELGRIAKELAPPTLEEMYAELEEKARKLEEEVKRLRKERVSPEKARRIAEMERKVKELSEQLKQREIELKEAREEAERLRKELEMLKPTPAEVVYVHIERGYPGPDRYFEFTGFYGRYVGNVCDIIEVDKRDYETSGFKSLLDAGIVRLTPLSPEQGESVKEKVRNILRERGFPRRILEETFYNIIAMLDYSKSYSEVLKEAEARARAVPVPTGAAILSRIDMKRVIREVMIEEIRRAEEYAGIKGASQKWLIYWLRHVKRMPEEEFYRLSDEERKKIEEEWVDWMRRRRGVGLF